MSPKDTAYIVERLAVRFMAMVAEYERKLLEHRDAFGVRTSADAKIIEGMRQQIETLNREERSAHDALEPLVDRVVKERDGLLTQVQDQRAEIERLKLACDTYAADWDTAGKACRIRVDEYPLSSVIRLVRDDAERAAVAKRLVKECDALRAEVADLRGIVDMVHASLGIKQGDHIGNAMAALKAQAPKRSHPVKAGEWVKAPLGTRGKVVSLGVDYLEVELTNGPPTRWWPVYMCEPCDPPEATHDTEAGKAAAESVAQHSAGIDIGTWSRKVTT